MSGHPPAANDAARPADEHDDQPWFDLLAGRPAPGASRHTQAEAEALRGALRRHGSTAPTGQPAPADERITRLLTRARADGVLPAAAGAGPRQHPSRRAWAGAGLAAGVAALGLALLLQRPDAEGLATDSVLRGAAVQQLQAVDPLRRRDQLLQALRAAGFDAQPFDRLGRPGLDIALPVPLPPAQVRALADLGLAAPPGPSLLVELLPATPPGGDPRP